jgi:predicted RNA-binding protein with PUA-like domain
MSKSKQYWLFKTEPQKFAIQDLARAPKQTTCWEGVRNYQARNFMRDAMRGGDEVLIYHSNADPPGIAGLARIVREAYPDHYAWDPRSAYYDPKSSAEEPRWVMVDVQLDAIFPSLLVLSELRKVPALKHMELLRKGSRLSIQPVRKPEFEAILKMVAVTRGRPPR